MTPPDILGQEASYYAYYVPNPFKEVRGVIDKNGCLCFMSMEQYLEECAKPKNRFTPTTTEMLLPKICIGLAVLMIVFLIASSLKS